MRSRALDAIRYYPVTSTARTSDGQQESEGSLALGQDVPVVTGGRSPALAGWLVATVGLLLAAVPAAPLLAWLGLPFPVAAALAVALGLGLASHLHRRVPAAVTAPLAGRPLVLAAWLALSLLAVARLGGLAEFMADPSQSAHSAFGFDEFYIGHNCLTAYFQAARLSQAGTANLYEPTLYQEAFGRFRPDEFLYPPPFLLLPRLAMLVVTNFQVLRALWFAGESWLFLATWLAAAAWVGGRRGGLLALLAPAAFAATPVILTLQIGNFQIAAFSLGLLTVLAADRRPGAAGAVLAAATASKVFPGVLGIAYLVARRLRLIAWAAAWGLIFCALAWLWLGSEPFRTFLTYEMPRISSGEAFSWLGLDELAAVAAINDGIPGLAWKLKVLGFGELDPGWVGRLGWLYTLLLVGLAILAGRRLVGASRLRQAQLVMALLALAALRSPFEPDAYALLAPLWLLLLMVPELPARPPWRWAAAAAWLVLAAVLPFGSLGMLAPRTIALLSLLGQGLSLGLCLGVVLRPSVAREAGTRTAPVAPLPEAAP